MHQASKLISRWRSSRRLRFQRCATATTTWASSAPAFRGQPRGALWCACRPARWRRRGQRSLSLLAPSNPRLLLTNARGPNRNRGASASLFWKERERPARIRECVRSRIARRYADNSRHCPMTHTSRRPRLDLLIAICHVAITAPTIAAQVTPIAPAPIASLVPRVDSIVQRYMQEAHIPGLLYGVVRRGRVEHIGTMGLQDLETRRP